MGKFSGERYILDVDYRWVEAFPLEELVENPSWSAKYLVHKNWRRSYLLNPRNYWSTDDYFNYAERKIRELEIKEP